jgi:prophage antirepressor-like protein
MITSTDEFVLFSYDGQPIRTFTDDNEIFFLATDVCKAIGVKSASGITARLSKTEWIMHERFFPVYEEYVALSKEGLINMLTRSHKPKAKLFLKWVVEYLFIN